MLCIVSSRRSLFLCWHGDRSRAGGLYPLCCNQDDLLRELEAKLSAGEAELNQTRKAQILAEERCSSTNETLQKTQDTLERTVAEKLELVKECERLQLAVEDLNKRVRSRFPPSRVPGLSFVQSPCRACVNTQRGFA